MEAELTESGMTAFLAKPDPTFPVAEQGRFPSPYQGLERCLISNKTHCQIYSLAIAAMEDPPLASLSLTHVHYVCNPI